MRRGLLTALIVATAAVAGVAAIANAGGARSKTTLKVRACETGDDADSRLATFYGRMRALRHSRRMMMRFKLIDRTSGENAPADGAPPELSHWRRSKPFVKKFGYKQTVTGLERGRTYAARVTYRWVGRRHRTIKRVRRLSADCRQDGELPNLAIKRIRARPGLVPGTDEVYLVDVVNRGAAPAHDVAVDLIVDSVSADRGQIAEIAPGKSETVEITGPVCKARVRAVADPDEQISETTDDDNSRRTRCPAVAL
jgi:hypothetical protein